MDAAAGIYTARQDHEQAAEWLTKAAETGWPLAMFNLGVMFDQGKGVAAPDYPVGQCRLTPPNKC
jgi:TPR repeat protein